MKLSVRSQVFETNSSSMHAIIIDNTNTYDDKDLIQFINNFPPTIYTNAYVSANPKLLVSITEKVLYLWTAICQYCYEYGPSNEHNSFQCIKENYPYNNLDSWQEKIIKVTACNFYFQVPDFRSQDYFSDHTINHGDILIPLLKTLYDDEELLKNFIMGKDSFIMLANDELSFEEAYTKLKVSTFIEKALEEQEINNLEENIIYSFNNKMVNIFIKDN